MKGLERHYDKLSPRERVAMITAAWMRSDDAEAMRLIDGAPQRQYVMGEHVWLGTALRQVELVYLSHQLDTAVTFWRTLGMAESVADDERSERLLLGARALAFRMVQASDGWKLFCEELGVPAPGYIEQAPMYRNVADTLDAARLMAFSQIEMVEWLEAQEPGGAAEAQPLTAEASADTWRQGLAALA
jgi:hypothetical protein